MLHSRVMPSFMECQVCQNKKNCPYLYIYAQIYKSMPRFIYPYPDLYIHSPDLYIYAQIYKSMSRFIYPYPDL